MCYKNLGTAVLSFLLSQIINHAFDGRTAFPWPDGGCIAHSAVIITFTPLAGPSCSPRTPSRSRLRPGNDSVRNCSVLTGLLWLQVQNSLNNTNLQKHSSPTNQQRVSDSSVHSQTSKDCAPVDTQVQILLFRFAQFDMRSVWWDRLEFFSSIHVVLKSASASLASLGRNPVSMARLSCSATTANLPYAVLRWLVSFASVNSVPVKLIAATIR